MCCREGDVEKRISAKWICRGKEFCAKDSTLILCILVRVFRCGSTSVLCIIIPLDFVECIFWCSLQGSLHACALSLLSHGDQGAMTGVHGESHLGSKLLNQLCMNNLHDANMVMPPIE